MTTSETRPNFDLFDRDELDDVIAESIAVSPAFACAVDDVFEIRQLLDQLVRLRKRAGLTQTDIAKLMDVRQPTVSQFETESSDPRLSTVQRYARSIGCRVTMCVLDNDGVYTARAAYLPASIQDPTRQVPVKIRSNSQAFEWKADLRSNYELA